MELQIKQKILNFGKEKLYFAIIIEHTDMLFHLKSMIIFIFLRITRKKKD